MVKAVTKWTTCTKTKWRVDLQIRKPKTTVVLFLFLALKAHICVLTLEERPLNPSSLSTETPPLHWGITPGIQLKKGTDVVDNSALN